MRNASPFVGFFLIMGILFLPATALTFSSGAPASRTGAPGDASSCNISGCHDSFALNSGSGSVTFEAPTTYSENETIEFSIKVANAGAARFGFSITAKDVNNDHQGTWTLVDGANTQFASNNSNYVTHDNAVRVADENTWTLQWTAPNANVGDIMFYVAGNAANGNGSTSGDRIYTASHTLTFSTGVGTGRLDLPETLTLERAYPNPFSGQATIPYQLAQAEPVTLTVYDAQGRVVQTEALGVQPAGSHTATLAAETLPPGVYLYEVRTPNARQTQTIALVH